MYNRSPYNRTPYNRNNAPNRTKSRPMTLAFVLEAQPARVIRFRSQAMGTRLSMDTVDIARIKSFESRDATLGLEMVPGGLIRVREFQSMMGIEMVFESVRQHLVTHATSESMDIVYAFTPLCMRLIAVAACDFHISFGIDGYASVVWRFASNALPLHLDFDAQDAIYTMQTAELDVTIKPGQTLIIDSYPHKYTAVLDGENVLEQYRGDWIAIDPNSIMAQISFDGGGTAFVQIEVQERWI